MTQNTNKFHIAGTDIKIVKVEAGTGTAGGDKQQAVNLSKPHERHPSGGWISHTQAQNKPNLEVSIIDRPYQFTYHVMGS